MEFFTSVVVECVGAPLATGLLNENGRRKCGTKPCLISIPQNLRASYPRQTYIRKILNQAKWTNLKTLGKKEWLCPTCVKRVRAARAASKARWG